MVKRNHFTEKLLNKSSQELERIIGSTEYVDDAKIAAKWILEERGTSINYSPPKKTKEKIKAWIPGRRHTPEIRKHYEFSIIGFGIALIFMTLHFNLENLLTTQSSLIEITGTVQNSDVIVQRVSSRGRLGYTRYSRKATLYFRLNGDDRLFKLFENVGQDYSHEEYDRISAQLKRSNNVSIWINKNQADEHEPKVFQIDIDDRTVVDFQTIKHEHSGSFIFMLFLGSLSVALGLYSKHPKQFRKLLRLNN